MMPLQQERSDQRTRRNPPLKQVTLSCKRGQERRTLLNKAAELHHLKLSQDRQLQIKRQLGKPNNLQELNVLLRSLQINLVLDPQCEFVCLKLSNKLRSMLIQTICNHVILFEKKPYTSSLFTSQFQIN